MTHPLMMQGLRPIPHASSAPLAVIAIATAIGIVLALRVLYFALRRSK